MLNLSRHILTRVRTEVPGFVTVANASVIAPLNDIGPLLPACIISPGPGDLVAQGAAQTTALEDQEWDVAVIIGYSHKDEDFGVAEIQASKLMDGVYRALHGWKTDNGEMRSGFIYKNRLEPVYNKGWVIFPLFFTARAVIGRGEC